MKKIYSQEGSITLSIWREKYQIPACVIRKLLDGCFYCKQQNAKPKHPVMGNLPTDRTAIENNPFASVCVD